MVIEELVKAVLSELRQITRTETVIGKPLELEKVTIIPVSRISLGFGAGGGAKEKEKGQGEASGGGASIEPVAFIVVKGEKAELVTIQKRGDNLAKVIDLVPEILEKTKNFAGRKKGKDEKAE